MIQITMLRLISVTCCQMWRTARNLAPISSITTSLMLRVKGASNLTPMASIKAVLNLMLGSTQVSYSRMSYFMWESSIVLGLASLQPHLPVHLHILATVSDCLISDTLHAHVIHSHFRPTVFATNLMTMLGFSESAVAPLVIALWQAPSTRAY